MKLKQAVKIARGRGRDWVLVTHDGRLMAFNGIPMLKLTSREGNPPVPENWAYVGPEHDGAEFLSEYTGSTPWPDSLRLTRKGELIGQELIPTEEAIRRFEDEPGERSGCQECSADQARYAAAMARVKRIVQALSEMPARGGPEPDPSGR